MIQLFELQYRYLGNESVAEVLIRHGANVNAENKDKWTPLHCSANVGEFFRY